MRVKVVLILAVIKFISLTGSHGNQPDISNSILDVDIKTGLIQFNRIASTIHKMPSGGMVSKNRRLSTVKLAMRAILDGIEGDFMETGVYEGGTAVLMTAVLLGLEPISSRRIYLADSFQGLPKDTDILQWKTSVNNSSVLGARVVQSLHGEKGQFNTTRKKFEENMLFNGFDVRHLQHRIEVLEGFYSETLPQLKNKNLKLSFLRLDGDIYISTMQALENAYDLVQPGGYIYVDDYGSFEGCRRAVDVFKASVEDNAPLIPIFEHNNVAHFEAVWWRKPRYSTDEHLTYLTTGTKIDLVKVIYVLVTWNMLLLFAYIYSKRSTRNIHH